MLAGVIGAAVQALLPLIPDYYETIIARYDVVLFIEAMLVVVPVYVMAYRNPEESAARLAVGAITASVLLYAARMLYLRYPDMTDPGMRLILPTVAHAIIIVPCAFVAAFVGRRAKRSLQRAAKRP